MRPLLLLALVLCQTSGIAFASNGPTEADLKQCVKTTKIVFSRKSDREPKILDKYYEPGFRALIKKGGVGESGLAPFLDGDFLRLTQDTPPRIVKIGPAQPGKDGKVSVPVTMRYTPTTVRTNTAVFRMVEGRWMICDLVSDGESLAAELRKEFGN